MKIKPGCSYLQRDGKLVTFSEDAATDHVYIYANNKEKYVQRTGKFFRDEQFSNRDLVKEVRVTIEEIKPESEFGHLSRLFASAYVLKKSGSQELEYYKHEIMNEIERLRKLFEGNKDE